MSTRRTPGDVLERALISVEQLAFVTSAHTEKLNVDDESAIIVDTSIGRLVVSHHGHEWHSHGTMDTSKVRKAPTATVALHRAYHAYKEEGITLVDIDPGYEARKRQIEANTKTPDNGIIEHFVSHKEVPKLEEFLPRLRNFSIVQSAVVEDHGGNNPVIVLTTRSRGNIIVEPLNAELTMWAAYMEGDSDSAINAPTPGSAVHRVYRKQVVASGDAKLHAFPQFRKVHMIMELPNGVQFSYCANIEGGRKMKGHELDEAARKAAEEKFKGGAKFVQRTV